MNPEVKKLQEQIDILKRGLDSFNSATTITKEVDGAFRKRFASVVEVPADLASAPLTAVTSPTGGSTVDSQARTAIDAIITRLEDLGLISGN